MPYGKVKIPHEFAKEKGWVWCLSKPKTAHLLISPFRGRHSHRSRPRTNRRRNPATRQTHSKLLGSLRHRKQPQTEGDGQTEGTACGGGRGKAGFGIWGWPWDAEHWGTQADTATAWSSAGRGFLGFLLGKRRSGKVEERVVVTAPATAAAASGVYVYFYVYFYLIS